jgi:hypothetical protein
MNSALDVAGLLFEIEPVDRPSEKLKMVVLDQARGSQRPGAGLIGEQGLPPNSDSRRLTSVYQNQSRISAWRPGRRARPWAFASRQCSETASFLLLDDGAGVACSFQEEPVHFDARQYESPSTNAKVAAFLPVQGDRHRAQSPSARGVWTGPLR